MIKKPVMKRITTLVFALLFISVPLMIRAGGAKESSAERGEYLAGKGTIIPPQEIFIDSYISYIDYHYTKPERGVGVSLYAGHHQLSAKGQEEIIQIGIQGRETSFEELPPMNLAFVVDKSMSMSEQDKIDWIKDSFDVFAERVRAKDFISLVVFDDEAKVIFPSTQMRSIQDIMNFREAVHSVIPGGGDNLESGLALGYQQVEIHFRKNYTNRVLLLSDGIEISEDAVSGIFQMVGEFNDEHINLSTIGVGANYNLELMRDLSDKGGGSSRFISGREGMEKTFGSDLERTFVPTARNLLMELEFLQDVEILNSWGYNHRIDGNTVQFFLETLHHRDYETILVQVRIPQQDTPGSIQEKNLSRFSISYTDLKCKQHSLGPYLLQVNFVAAESPFSGISDGMVLQSVTMLHYAQELKKIGELYYAEQFKPAFDLAISIQNEVKNTRLRLGNMGFENEIELLDKYIAILGQHLALTKSELKDISTDAEPLPSVQGRSLEDDIATMFREITLVLESKRNITILVPGFIASEGRNSGLISLLNETALLEMSRLSNISVIDEGRLDVIMEKQGINVLEPLDTKTAIDIGKKAAADYVLAGSVNETANSIAIFCRLINVNDARVEVVPQIITSRVTNEGP
jgi:TolB-like protein